jgi:serine protease Do
VRRGYLGIFLDSVKAEFARVYGLPEAKGAVVTDVRDPSGPAGKAGIQANDIIVEYNGQPITSAQDLINKVAATAVGSSVTITYLRDAGGKLERRAANVTIGERPAALAPASDEETVPPPKEKETPQANRVRLGITLMEITPQIAKEKNLANVPGLLVKEVDPNGIAADAGSRAVRENEVIQRINRVPVSTLAEFQRVVDNLKPGDAVVLNVARYDKDSERVIQRIVQFTYQ